VAAARLDVFVFKMNHPTYKRLAAHKNYSTSLRNHFFSMRKAAKQVSTRCGFTWTVIFYRPVVLKVGGIDPLGAILKGRGQKNLRVQNNTKVVKMINH